MAERGELDGPLLGTREQVAIYIDQQFNRGKSVYTPATVLYPFAAEAVNYGLFGKVSHRASASAPSFPRDTIAGVQCVSIISCFIKMCGETSCFL